MAQAWHCKNPSINLRKKLTNCRGKNPTHIKHNGPNGSRLYELGQRLARAIDDHIWEARVQHLIPGEHVIIRYHRLDSAFRGQIIDTTCRIIEGTLVPSARVLMIDTGKIREETIGNIFLYPPMVSNLAQEPPLPQSVDAAKLSNGKLIEQSKRNQQSNVNCFSSFVYFLECQLHQTRTRANQKLSLIPVVVVWWDSPDTIFVRPRDREYSDYVTRYQSWLDQEQEDNDTETQHWSHNSPKEDDRYRPGNLVIFQNSFKNNMGRWLRGEILSIVDTRNLIYEDGEFNLKLAFRDCINPYGPPRDCDLYYRVRSIDYGFVIFARHQALRRLSRKYQHVGPLALHARLFGIHPNDTSDFEGPKQWSSGSCRHWPAETNEALHVWMHHREQDHFYILLRSQLDHMKRPNLTVRSTPQDLPSVELNLFSVHHPTIKSTNVNSQDVAHQRGSMRSTRRVFSHVSSNQMNWKPDMTTSNTSKNQISIQGNNIISTNGNIRKYEEPLEYESLNSYLVLGGFATDHNSSTSIESKINLDQVVLNQNAEPEEWPIPSKLISENLRRIMNEFNFSALQTMQINGTKGPIKSNEK